MTADTSFLPLAQSLLGCLAEAVADVTEPPANTCLRFGDSITFDLSENANECCDGLAWVRLASATPGWPDPPQGASPCWVAQWSVLFEVGVVRCHPVGDMNQIVGCEAYAVMAGLLMEDFRAMREALCCFAEASPGLQVKLGGYSPVGPEGGCAGGTMQLTVEVFPNP